MLKKYFLKLKKSIIRNLNRKIIRKEEKKMIKKELQRVNNNKKYKKKKV
jgi:hypothetical protein